MESNLPTQTMDAPRVPNAVTGAVTSHHNSLQSHCPSGNSAQSSSPLLRLPSEIRYLIWTHALVRPNVYVTWSSCDETMQDIHSRTCIRFRYWTPACDAGNVVCASGTYVALRKKLQDWISLSLSVVGGKSITTSIENDRPQLNTFSICRQILNEASPIFYSKNCFVFCGPHEVDPLGCAGLLAAYAFLKDRSKDTLLMIKHIELHFIAQPIAGEHDEERVYPLLPGDQVSKETNCHHEMFSFLHTNLDLEYLGLSFAGWSTAHRLPDRTLFHSDIYSILEEICDLRKVGRLAIKYATQTRLLETSPADPSIPDGDAVRCHIHLGHGSHCFARDVTLDSLLYEDDASDITWQDLSGCGIAHESLRAAAFARLLRHRILEKGDQKGYQDIQIVMGVRDGMSYMMLSTDDDKVGKSHLAKQRIRETAAGEEITEVDPFADAGGSQVLDAVQPVGWTPKWAVEGK